MDETIYVFRLMMIFNVLVNEKGHVSLTIEFFKDFILFKAQEQLQQGLSLMLSNLLMKFWCANDNLIRRGTMFVG